MAQASRITLRRIGAQLGVSATTVSRSLNGQGRRYRISKKTEEAVRTLAAELGFAPNRLARGLRLKKTATIGLVIPDVSNPFFASIARQVACEARKHSYSVILCDSQDSVDLEIEALDVLCSRSVEGLVLCPVGQSSDHLAEFEHGDLPVVLVDRYFPDVELPYVVSDNAGGARDATDFLIGNGHRRIACLQGLHGTAPNEERLRGYMEALTAHSIRVDEQLIAGDSFSQQSGYIHTKLLLRTKSEFTAIFALSNQISLGAVRALAEEKIGIPDDVSVVAFDDQPYMALLAVPMTTVAQRHNEMGEIAVKLLFDWIQSSRPIGKQGIILPTSLVTRQSVKPLDLQKQ